MTKLGKTFTTAVALTVVMGACGGDDGDDQAGLPTGAGGDSSVQEAETPPQTQLPVPELYDTTRGWESALPGERMVLPHTQAIAIFGGERQFTVLDVTNGETLWSSVPVQPDRDFIGLHTMVASVDGEDYLVTWSSDVVESDAVSRGSEVTTIDIFPAGNSGDAVEPAHHLELEGDGSVWDGGAGLVVERDDGTVVSVDLASGTTEDLDLDDMEPPSNVCGNCGVGELIAITPNGPLVTVEPFIGESGFWVPGNWSTSDVKPENASDSEPFVALVEENALVAKWGPNIWTVVDSDTGEVQAQVDCENHRGSELAVALDAALSPNRRYLVRGYTVFDLEQGTGHCFESTTEDLPIYFSEVTDDGIAFGLIAPSRELDEDGGVSGTPAMVDIADGEVHGTDEHWETPLADIAGFGLFWDDTTQTMVAYPHAA